MAAAALVRRLREDGASVGLAAPGPASPAGRIAYVPPGESAAQLGECLDLLARVEPYPWLPFERLLTILARTARPGTSILVLSGRDPLPYLATLRRVARLGFPVRHVAFGDEGPRRAGRAHSAGIDAIPVRLAGPWQTATALLVARASAP